MIFKAFIQRIHVWAGLILGIQVFLWMLSGIVMTWFHIELVRGERSMFVAPPAELEATSYASPGGVIAQVDGASSVELRTFLNLPVYEVRGTERTAIFNAQTGERIPISEDLARRSAKADYVGEGEIIRVTLMSDPPHEYRGSRPVWRADFDDTLKTRLYISQSTGEVVSRRNMIWRVYDFFWALHIMDWDERTNFNSWWLKAFALFGTIFALSGLIMLFLKSSRRLIVADTNFVLTKLGLKRRK
jgi:hypothetical protein